MLWNLILGLVFLGTNRYGDYITDECPQASYSCPSICDVDHKHLPLKECKNGKTEEERAEGNQKVQKSNSKKRILIDAKTE